jgi:hypothetical protein
MLFNGREGVLMHPELPSTGPRDFEPGRSLCLHCGKVVRSDKNAVVLWSFLLPPWELLSHRHSLALHTACWEKWPLRQRYTRRVNASGKYLLREDGSWAHAPGPATDRNPATIAEGRLQGVFRDGAGPRLQGKRWTATLWLDYLEESRFLARFRLACPLGQWGSCVVVDVPAVQDRAAVLQQAMQTVTKEIERRRVGSWISGSPHSRSCLFRVSRTTWFDEFAEGTAT